MYHMISDSKNGFFPETSIVEFEKQVKYLKKNYRVLDVESIIEKIKRREFVEETLKIPVLDGTYG